MGDHFDVIIIGAGVVGSMVARELSRYELDILWLEKEGDVGTGASGANTAIVHAGYDPVPGTLKAAMNVRANPMWDQLAAELDFPFQRRGDYVVAVGEEELPSLDRLWERGRKNGVLGLRRLSAAEMMRREPRINPLVSGALWAPTGGVCDPFAIVIAAAEHAVINGVKLMLSTGFRQFVIQGRRIVGVETTDGTFGCRWVVNGAGLNADEVMHKAGVRPGFNVRPRKGEYFVLDRSEPAIENVLFPVPSADTKGILVAASTHGNTVVGPNSRPVSDKKDRAVSREGLQEVWQGARKLVPQFDQRHIIAAFAGLRATGNARCQTPGVDYEGDFVVELPDEVRGLVNLGGIESPGLTSAPAIAKRVVELLRDAGEALQEKPHWQPTRTARVRFRDLRPEQQKALVQKDPRYGRIVCRCECVTEGEVIAEIHAPIRARTYDALKRRTWLGTGRCQGAFDTPRVVEILARELGVSPLEITKKGSGSEMLARTTKGQ